MAELNIDLELYKKLMDNPRVKASKVPLYPEKHLSALDKTIVHPENNGFLESKEIYLVPSEWVVLDMEPEELKKNVAHAESLGFIDAYKQNPAFIKPDSNEVYKRMGNLEHLGIPYKNEKGKYQSFLFSERGTNYVITNATGVVEEKREEKAVEHTVDPFKLKEATDRVIEVFALESEREQIYARLDEIMATDLGLKEMLIEVFKGHSENLEFLVAKIDEVLETLEENKLKVAA